jgi:peptide-methionine (S)-S-oxide reductase
VTEIVPLTTFYKAERYHQNYYNNNPNASYCAFVIRPKLDKLLKKLAPPKP